MASYSVAVDIGGTFTDVIVIDRETGLLIQQRNPVALADGLELLLTTPTIRSQMAFAARALVECEFNIHRNAARIRQLFGEMAVDDTAAADTAAVAAVARQLQEA